MASSDRQNAVSAPHSLEWIHKTTATTRAFNIRCVEMQCRRMVPKPPPHSIQTSANILYPNPGHQLPSVFSRAATSRHFPGGIAQNHDRTSLRLAICLSRLARAPRQDNRSSQRAQRTPLSKEHGTGQDKIALVSRNTTRNNVILGVGIA